MLHSLRFISSVISNVKAFYSSDGSVLRAIEIYIKEFHRKKLKSLPECQSYYAGLPTNELLSEAGWLLGADTAILPYHMLFQRYYALFEAMTARAVISANFSDNERMEFINTTIGVKEEIIRRAPKTTREQLMRLLRDNCKSTRSTGRFRRAADAIRNSTRDYPGPFNDNGSGKDVRRKPKVGPEGLTGKKIIIHPGSSTMQ